MITARKRMEVFTKNQERKEGGLGGNLRFPSSLN
jgi:hypothetical protein